MYKIGLRVEVAIVSTIKDIAKAAGVSIATVSIVLNGKGRERKISQETQQRIYKIAQDLNYVPNQYGKEASVSTKGQLRHCFLLGNRLSYQLLGPYHPRYPRRNHETE